MLKGIRFNMQATKRSLRITNKFQSQILRAFAGLQGVSAEQRCFGRSSVAHGLHSSANARYFMLDGPREAADASGTAPSNWYGIKRFYTEVGVEQATADGDSHNGWHVMVQGRALRTSNLNELVLPTKALALAVAAEFGMQGRRVVPSTTPLYNLCCSAIDGYAVDDERRAKTQESSEVVSRADKYLKHQALLRLAEAGDAAAKEQLEASTSTSSSKQVLRRATEASIDTTVTVVTDADAKKLGQSWTIGAACRRVADRGWEAEDGAVSCLLGDIHATKKPAMDSGMQTAAMAGTDRLRNQLKEYLETDTACYRVRALSAADSILRRKQDRHYQPLLDWFREAYGVQLSIAEGLSVTEHPVEALEICEDLVDRADPFLRAALAMLLGSTKSSLTAMALLHRQITAAQAFECARVEEEFYIEENGFVEDGHDTARAETMLKAASASTFLWLLPQSAPGRDALAYVVGPQTGTAEQTTPDAQGLVDVTAEPRRRRRRRKQQPTDGGATADGGEGGMDGGADAAGASGDYTPRVVRWSDELRAAIGRTRRRRCLELCKELLEEEKAEELRVRWNIEDDSKRFADMSPEEAQVAALKELYKKHTAGAALATELLDGGTEGAGADDAAGSAGASSASAGPGSVADEIREDAKEGARRGQELDRLLSQVPGLGGIPSGGALGGGGSSQKSS